MSLYVSYLIRHPERWLARRYAVIYADSKEELMKFGHEMKLSWRRFHDGFHPFYRLSKRQHARAKREGAIELDRDALAKKVGVSPKFVLKYEELY